MIMIIETKSLAIRTGLYLGLLCLSYSMAWGQATNSADVTGSVTDPSGAAVPDVSVTVRDVDKNVEHMIVTNASGLYDTGPVVPTDRYLFIFKKEGFATLQRGPMTLSTGVTGLNVELTLAQSAQQVVI